MNERKRKVEVATYTPKAGDAVRIERFSQRVYHGHVCQDDLPDPQRFGVRLCDSEGGGLLVVHVDCLVPEGEMP